ncbi:hypothetical protein CEE36_10865 [candidate division TA06 bacterium B3_TA06]|uniref:Uncharacterized protein n=1 Tax=candidate division TA06 bacterium B3_TA06 TaxID=2012487 RepID=A0A532USU3_UNCT6|nr:MAG: hypothetical protein CEE36_10865 [candidate division TA06 bacterium B3_TA06]
MRLTSNKRPAHGRAYLLALALVAVFGLVLTGCEFEYWPGSPEPFLDEGDEETFYLYAAQHHRVGELLVWNDSSFLYVKYVTDEGYDMSETHLHVDPQSDSIPQANGNPIPGRFDYKEEHDPRVNEYTYEVEWDSTWDGKDLNIAAHAMVWGVYDDTTDADTTEETAWARMYDDPEDFTHEFPGKNWATYVTYEPEEGDGD